MRNDRTELLVLGEVGIRHNGVVHQPSSALLRALLALLAHAGAAGAGQSRLEEVIWGGQASASTVTVSIHRLRRWLAEVVGETARIDHSPRGYRLTTAGPVVDAARLCSIAAESARLPPRQRVDVLRDALALCTGPVLADVPPERTDPVMVARLERDLRAAAIACGRALLAAGEPAEAGSAFQALTEKCPYDEAVHAVWIEALAASGRQAQALTAFQAIRGRLRAEFGVDPGPELSLALDRVLRPAPGRPAARVTVPAQLPPEVAGFCGRDDEMATLTAALETHGAAALVGMGGVGKSSLAVHWAHRSMKRFPDGQLYADLRGATAGPPARAIDVLARFLRALGVPAGQLPSDVDDAETLYRSVLADRRLLVVLDNAADVAQVRPLLPAAPGSRAVVTGRDGLDGLTVVNGAARLQLDVLPEQDAVAAVRGLLGELRTSADPAGVRALVRLCGGLPLALRIAGVQLIRTGHVSIADYAARLRDGDRLAELAVDGDPRASVRAVLEHSYRRLPERTRRVFRLLGAVPGPEFTSELVARLAGFEPGRELDRLAAAQLVEPVAPGRFAVHGLVQDYARAEALPGFPNADTALLAVAE
jgi:DNA-binding SARP family transcriptional activator